MRILVLSDALSPWHSVWIRIGQYLQALPWHADVCSDCQLDRAGELHGICPQRGVLPACQLIILYRWSPLEQQRSVEALTEAIRHGIPLIADLDDNLWQADPAIWSRRRLKLFVELLRHAHLMTCSTENLRQMLSTMFPNHNMQLLKNHAPKPRHNNVAGTNSGKIRIGWTGAPWTRPNDLEQLRPLAHWIAKQPTLQLVHVGHRVGRLNFAQALRLEENQVECYPLQPYISYLNHLNFEIGLAPLIAGGFNSYKSELKLLEYASQGIAWIASNVDPYRDLCEEWEWTGRLAANPNDWIEHLKQLLDEKMYCKEAQILQEICMRRRPFRDGVKQWQRLIEDVRQ